MKTFLLWAFISYVCYAQIDFIKGFPDIEEKLNVDFLLQAGNNDLLNFWMRDTLYFRSSYNRTNLYIEVRNKKEMSDELITSTGRSCIGETARGGRIVSRGDRHSRYR